MSDRGADIPSAQLDSPVNDMHLAEIAREYLRSWEELAPRLELTPVQEEEIRNTYGRYGNQKLEALRLWRRIKGSTATYRALIAAAVAISNEQLADNIRGLLRASGQPTHPITPQPGALLRVSTPAERLLSKPQCTQCGGVDLACKCCETAKSASHQSQPIPSSIVPTYVVPNTPSFAQAPSSPCPGNVTRSPAPPYLVHVSYPPPPTPCPTWSHDNMPYQPASIPTDIPTSSAMKTSVSASALVSYEKQIRDGYSISNPVMALEWPPPPTLKYISLAMIKQKKLDRGEIADRFIRMTIHGDTDDILHDKVPVKVEQLFSCDSSKQDSSKRDSSKRDSSKRDSSKRDSCKRDSSKRDSCKREVILVEGAPGSGKSTLLWHICQKWQSGELFQQFTLVLLVLLRDTAVHNAKCLADILPYLPDDCSQSSKLRDSIAKQISASCGEGVLIMLDGWDEAPHSLQQEGSLIHDIITAPFKRSLQKAAIVVSSRPKASACLWPYASTRVEVIGFIKERRNEYIQESIENPATAQKLMQQIEDIPQLGQNCHLPLNLVIITHTFLCSKNELPSTYCRTIITLALNCLLRHLQKNEYKSIEVLKSFSDVPDSLKEQFVTLCRIAYEGVACQRYSFSKQFLSDQGRASCEVETFGLLQAVHSLVSSGSSTVYHFLHLSLQELCAAYYIASLPDTEEQIMKIRNLKTVTSILYSEVAKGGVERAFEHRNPRFDPVCQFYSALTRLSNSRVLAALMDEYPPLHVDLIGTQQHVDLERIQNLSMSTDNFTLAIQNQVELNECRVSFDFLHCLYEAQNPSLGEKLIGTVLKITGDISPPALPLAYMISTAPHLKIFSYSHSKGPGRFSGQVYLEKPVADALSNSSVAEFIVGELVVDDAHVDLFSIIFKNKHLRKVEIYNCFENFPLPFRLFLNGSVDNIIINNNAIDIATLNYLGKLLLQRLTLKKCGIGNMQELSSALSSCTTLKYLDISGNYIDSHGACLLAKAVNKTSVEELDMSDCDIENSAIREFLSHLACTTLKYLNISGNDIDHIGAHHLVLALKYNIVLEKLDISDCRIGNDGIASIFSALRTSTALKVLDVSENSFGTNGIIKIAEALNHTSLQELDIRYCSEFKQEGILALFSVLSTNTTLNYLRISENETMKHDKTSMIEYLMRNTRFITVFIEDDLLLSDQLQAKLFTKSNFWIHEKYFHSTIHFNLDVYSLLREAFCSGNIEMVVDILGLQRPPVRTDKLVIHFRYSENETIIDFSQKIFIKLSLQHCQLCAKSLQYLSTTPYCHHLKYLDISGNRIGHSEAAVVAIFLQRNPVEFLSISDCSIDSVGMESICSAIKTSSILKSLNISKNKMNDVKLPSTLTTILSQTPLKELDMSHCDLREEALAEVCTALSTNTTLTHLRLGGNDFILPKHATSKLILILKSTSLEVIDIHGCSVAEDSMDEVYSTLSTSTTITSISLPNSRIGPSATSHRGDLDDLVEGSSLYNLDTRTCDNINL